MADRSHVAVLTLKCEDCGSTWSVTERFPDGEDRLSKTDTYRCPECGHAAVHKVWANRLRPGRPPRDV
jgi:DNA-directed RNA polymerase subunit RPC12/RpoP